MARSDHDGFALLAMLILVAIVGLATAAVVTTDALVARRAAEEQLLYVGAQYRTALQLYAEATPAGQSRYPRTLADLLSDARFPEPRHYLRALYPDPISSGKEWILLPSPDGGVMGLHSSSEQAPIRQINFAPPFEQFNRLAKYSDWVFYYYAAVPAP